MSGGDTGLLIQELVYAGLESLRVVMPLDLCAYLHATDDRGPQLFLATPDLSSIDPNQAFNLFNELRDAMERSTGSESRLSIGSYSAIAIPSMGAQSRGLHVAGRLGSVLTDDESDALSRLARALGGAAHTMETAAASTAGAVIAPIRVAVEMVESGARAEVSVPLGAVIRTGEGRATTPSRAVGEAVLDACDDSLKLGAIGDTEVAGERVLIAIVSDASGRSAVGSSLTADRSDSLQAVAAATLDAVLHLLPSRA
jgi:hypothetical protein